MQFAATTNLLPMHPEGTLKLGSSGAGAGGNTGMCVEEIPCSSSVLVDSLEGCSKHSYSGSRILPCQPIDVIAMLVQFLRKHINKGR